MKNILNKIEFHYTYIIMAFGLVITGHFVNLIIFTSLIIIHEMGHQLDGYLTQRGVWGGNVSLYGTTRTSVAVKREVLQQLGYFDYIRAERAEWTRM